MEILVQQQLEVYSVMGKIVTDFPNTFSKESWGFASKRFVLINIPGVESTRQEVEPCYTVCW